MAKKKYLKSILFIITFLIISNFTCIDAVAVNIFEIVAHRGGASGSNLPESSQVAFDKAIEIGFDSLETDISMTKDGVPVLFHDKTLDRITEETGPINEKTYAELKKIKFKGFETEDYHIVALEDFLNSVRDKKNKLYIELKNIEDRKDIELVMSMLKEFTNRCNIQSFNYDNLDVVRQLNSQIEIGYLINKIEDYGEAMKRIDKSKPYMFSFRYTILLERPEIIKELNDKNIEFAVWTVNSIEEVKVLVEMGVKRIISDYFFSYDKIMGAKPMPPKINNIGDNDLVIEGKGYYNKVNTYLNGIQIATNDLDIQGNFRVELPKPFKAGTEFIFISESTSGAKSDPVKVTVKDKTRPIIEKVNEITDLSTTVSGKTEGNIDVTVRVGSKSYKGRSNSKGNFTIGIPKLKAGTELLVRGIDLAGNKSMEIMKTVKDVIPPKNPTVNTVSNASPYVEGKGEAGIKVQIKVGSKYYEGKTSSVKGIFKIKIPSQRAGNYVYVRLIDKSNNKSSWVKKKVADKTAPTFTKINTVTNKDKTIVGKTEAYSSVRAKIGSKNYYAKADKYGKFLIKISKQKGNSSIYLYTKDKSGNESKGKKIIVKDIISPKTPTINKITSKSKYAYGEGEKNSYIYIKIGNRKYKTRCDSKGKYKIKIKMGKKNTPISIYSKDKSGNKSFTKKTKIK